MGKRQRHAEDSSRQHGDLAASANTRRRSGAVSRATHAPVRTAPSKDFFGSEWMNALDRHRKELPRPRRDERNGYGEKSRKRNSHHQPQQTSSTTDAPTQQVDSSDRYPQAFGNNTGHITAPRSTRNQRRRNKRKLIRNDVLPKRPDSQPAPHLRQQTSSGWSQGAPSPVPWKDKPIGRKALAHQPATTTLMKPPPRRWEGLEDGPAATPWQRSAAECEKVVLAEAPFGDEMEAKSTVSGAPSQPALPEIRTSDPDTSRRSQETRDLSLRDSLRSCLPFGLGLTPKTKRHSFGNKANSVPTYVVAGDPAERFKRFSAAAHGRGVDDSSDDSSESPSDDSEDGQSVANVSSGEKAGSIASAPDSDRSPLRNPRHLSEAPSENFDNLPLRGVKSMSELSAKANGQKQTQSRDNQVRPPSTQGSKRHASEMDETASQLSFPMRSQSAVGTPPPDADLFDAEQAVEDIIQSEMTLTRALPAGKKEPTTSTQREVEGGILTQDSSDLRMMPTGAKAQRSPLAKRIDSAMPDVEDDTIIVQSLQLPAQGGVEQQGLQATANEGATGDSAGDMDDSEARANASDIKDSRLFSPLSELAESPPAPQPRPASSAKSEVASAVTQWPPIYEYDIAKSDQAIEESATSKKKRKMTGLTSKHFSTPRVKTRSSKGLQTKTDGQRTSAKSAEGHASSARNVRKQTAGTPLSTVEAVLAETRALFRESSRTPDQGKSEQSKKRTMLRSGKITDLDDSNIIEDRTRRVSRMEDQEQPDNRRCAIGRAKSSKRKRSRQSEPAPARANDGEMVDAQDEDVEEAKTRPRKRARRSGGPITDFSTVNILEARSRRSMTALPCHDAREPSNENDLPEKEDILIPESESHHIGARKTKRRSRRSGGKITDVDSSNILSTPSRGRRRSTDIDLKTDEDRDNAKSAAFETADEPEPHKPRAKRKSTGKRSIYFRPPKPPLDPSVDRVDHYNTTGKKKRAPAGVSVAPVPSIHSDRFGIIQEKLWREPFWLLIAVTFLNKTAGRAAAPTFWKLKEQYQTPEALAVADQGELHDMIHHLGLQTQRSKRLIAMSKAWVEAEPHAGVRWRVLHYPEKGDGKGYKAGEPIEEDAADIDGAIEIGRIPGCGPYAMDSWRIFCRDVLRGVAEDYNGNNAEAEGFVPEWQKVLPGDKELRACLRWMWLREGWIWDHETGSKRRASEEEMEMAVRGQMEVPDEQEKVFAKRAARLLEAKGEQEDTTEESRRGKKRPATPEADEKDSDMSDNIVVGSPAKRRRSGRRKTA